MNPQRKRRAFRKTVYRARCPFRGDGPWYVEIRRESGWMDWLKVKDVPEPVRFLIDCSLYGDQSATCDTRARAEELAAWMNRFR